MRISHSGRRTCCLRSEVVGFQTCFARYVDAQQHHLLLCHPHFVTRTWWHSSSSLLRVANISVVTNNFLRRTTRRMNNWSRLMIADASEAIALQSKEDTPSTERAERLRIRHLAEEALDFLSQSDEEQEEDGMWLMRCWLLPEPFSKLQRVPLEVLHRHHIEEDVCSSPSAKRDRCDGKDYCDLSNPISDSSDVEIIILADSEDAEHERNVPRLNQRTTRRHRQFPFQAKCVKSWVCYHGNHRTFRLGFRWMDTCCAIGLLPVSRRVRRDRADNRRRRCEQIPSANGWRKGTPTTCASPAAGKSRQSRACTDTRPCSDPPAFFLAAAVSVMVFFLTRSRAAKRLGQNGAPTHQKALETTREKERSSVFLEPSLHLKGEKCVDRESCRSIAQQLVSCSG